MNNDTPNTLRAIDLDKQPKRQLVFEPALRQFSSAFRLGESSEANPEEWLKVQRLCAEVRAHLLELVAQSRWKEHLVLRGSTLMQSWFSEQARAPKDIDWVFQPQAATLEQEQSHQCQVELVDLVTQNPRTTNTEILTARIAWDSIWTYERAQGRRVVFPFRSKDGLEREVQMDIVWEEPLFEAPIQVGVPVGDGREVTLSAATPSLSLTWKLLWLLTDGYPQGKDLYDAVLLAEGSSPSPEVLQRTFEILFEQEPWYRTNNSSPAFLIKNLRVDWDNFKNDYPWVEGDEGQWLERLDVALNPALSQVRLTP